MTPSTRTAAAMLVVPAIANDEDVRDFGANIAGLAEAWLEGLAPEEAQANWRTLHEALPNGGVFRAEGDE